MQISFSQHKYSNNFKAVNVAKTNGSINGRNTTINIYQLTPKDIPYLRKLIHQISYKELFPSLNQLLQERWQRIFEYCIRQSIEDSDGSYIAICNNKPCGILTYQNDGNNIYLDGICSIPITKDKKVQNVGKSLFCHLFNIAQQQKVKHITLSAVQDGPFDVVKKYEEMGFKKDITSYPYRKMSCNKYEIEKQCKILNNKTAYQVCPHEHASLEEITT